MRFSWEECDDKKVTNRFTDPKVGQACYRKNWDSVGRFDGKRRPVGGAVGLYGFKGKT